MKILSIEINEIIREIYYEVKALSGNRKFLNPYNLLKRSVDKFNYGVYG